MWGIKKHKIEENDTVNQKLWSFVVQIFILGIQIDKPKVNGDLNIRLNSGRCRLMTFIDRKNLCNFNVWELKFEKLCIKLSKCLFLLILWSV